jgi:hypothetical protein
MKKKGYSYLDYYGLSQYRDVIEESRRLLGGKEGIHLKENDG